MTLRDLYLRLRALTRRRRVEQELDEELAFHLERETQKLMEQGLRPAEARREARRQFGSVALAADECRDARGTGFVDALLRDVGYALRGIRRAPLATLAVVATLALGLGLVAVVFTLYNAMFLATGVDRPEELVVVQRPPTPGAGVWVPFTPPQLETLRRGSEDVLTDAAGTTGRTYAAQLEQRPGSLALVSGNYFAVLGSRPLLGRPLVDADDAAGRRVMVLSHRGWARLFGADPSVVGRDVDVNGRAWRVVGVMADNVRGLEPTTPDAWAPIAVIGEVQESQAGQEAAIRVATVVGRLRAGVSREAAAGRLTAWAQGNPDLEAYRDAPKTIDLIPLRGRLLAHPTAGLEQFVPLFGAFGLVLLVACANVANMLLARGVARQREIGVRLSLGASRRRIVRQLLTESLMLALLAGVGGLVVSRLVLHAVSTAVITTVPDELAEQFAFFAPSLDWRIVLFVFAGAALSTALFGLLPAVQTTRLDLVRTMRGEVFRDARPGRTRHLLVGLQVSASALLLIGAAVLLRSSLIEGASSPGIRTSDTVMVELTNEASRQAVLQSLETDPSVIGLAASWPNALTASSGAGIYPVHGGEASDDDRAGAIFKRVSPEYFDLVDLPILVGRGFAPDERGLEAGVVVLSESTARHLAPIDEVIGRVVEIRAGFSGMEDHPSYVYDRFRVIGVVPDVDGDYRIVRPRTSLVAAHYYPGTGAYLPIETTASATSLTLRVLGSPDRATDRLRQRIESVDPAVGSIRTMTAVAGRDGYLLQTAFWLAAILGGLALTLTLSGLFGMLSYVVAQRTREIGVRMALGAPSRAVVRLVMVQSARPVVAGAALGAGLAVVLARLLMTTPIDTDGPLGAVPWRISDVVRVLDPAAYLVSLICIVAACALAAAIPTLRAARVNPVTALRHD